MHSCLETTFYQHESLSLKFVYNLNQWGKYLLFFNMYIYFISLLKKNHFGSDKINITINLF